MRISEEYRKVIAQLIEASGSGAIKWTKQNPTTIYQETRTASGATAIMSIQQVRRDRGHYVFTVKNASKGEVVVSIDSMRERELAPMLDELYQIANYSIEKRSLDFLDDIIRGFKK